MSPRRTTQALSPEDSRSPLFTEARLGFGSTKSLNVLVRNVDADAFLSGANAVFTLIQCVIWFPEIPPSSNRVPPMCLSVDYCTGYLDKIA